MKHYDYKDETKDVRGKVTPILPPFPHPYSSLAWPSYHSLDWETECHQWVTADAEWLEERGHTDYS